MRRLRAEWEEHNIILMSLPHDNTDWAKGNLEESYIPFVRIAQAIAYHQTVYLICKSKASVVKYFCSTKNIIFIEVDTNDTWVRDYGPFSIEKDSYKILLDFVFDGWGGKFESTLDNSASKALHGCGYFGKLNMSSIDYVLEGGSIDSDGNGTIMTTSKCLCNTNRNVDSTKSSVEKTLGKELGATRFLWLDYGYLSGDDTDSHIDTLARFVNEDTIVFVNCQDKDDEHYGELNKMKKQLQAFRKKDGTKYNLVELPMPKKIVDKDDNRLPATYANFLITNKALLYPTYNDSSDDDVRQIFTDLFPDREIIPINCLKLIEQGGSLHCSTMQISF